MNDLYQSIRKKFRVLPSLKEATTVFSHGIGNGVPVVPDFDGEFTLNNKYQWYKRSQEKDNKGCQDRKPLTELE